MKIRLLVTAVAISLPLAACGDAAEEPAVVDPATTEAATAPVATAQMPATPQEFVDMTAANDLYEIQASELAQQQATSQEVRDFAEQMVTDHTTSTQNLMEAASGAPTPLTATPQLTPEHQSNLDQLRNAGQNFDQVYMQQQVAAHEKALAILQDQARNGQVEPLRSFASETAEVVQNHLQMAREMTGAGAGMTGTTTTTTPSS